MWWALLPGALFTFEEYLFDRNERETSFAEWEVYERTNRALTTKSFKNGRRVARHPAMIPAPGSIVDQVAMLVAFPSINVNFGP